MPSVILEIDAAPKFAFLALPPPPKKKRAAVNNTFRAPISPVNRTSTILAWAETVLPGSPPPMTPASGIPLPHSASFVSSPRFQGFRRPSLTRVSSRRQSVSSTRSRIHSASFLHITHTPQTPAHPIPATPFSPDANFDFAAFGYASIFVDVPVSTPITGTPDNYNPKPMVRLPSFHRLPCHQIHWCRDVQASAWQQTKNNQISFSTAEEGCSVYLERLASETDGWSETIVFAPAFPPFF